MLQFNKEYYDRIVHENDYTFCKNLKRPLPNLSLEEMRSWLCAYNLEGDIQPSNTLVLMGIGVNNVPHMGTVSQFLRAIFLQQRGYKVHIILGDLDSYNLRGSGVKEAGKIAEKCHIFIRALGFDTVKARGIIRNQFDHEEVMKTAFLIAPSVKEQDFFDVEEDLSYYYQEVGLYQGLEFSTKQSILMMFADFIHPGLIGGYKNVVVLSGVDEHAYVKKANEIASRLGANFAVHGLFSPIIGGFNEQPKMSKGLASSAIYVNTPKRVIDELIQNTPSAGNHNDSIVFQLMRGILFRDPKFLQEAEEDFYDEQRWAMRKRNFSNTLSQICELWDKK
ncbi:MAG: hypothetical protein Q4B34_02100 [Candidatus Saccharibacteria bacterium]|nr:hypothetical protein [Candidatus Saccharibacteria bacterium]